MPLKTLGTLRWAVARQVAEVCHGKALLHPTPRMLADNVLSTISTGRRAPSLEAGPMLPARIPIFPLPTFVLSRTCFCRCTSSRNATGRWWPMPPRATASSACAAQARLGARIRGAPTVYPVGCAGVIQHVERLPRGRFNLVLKGLGKSDPQRGTRAALPLAVIDALPERLTDADRLGLQDQRRRTRGAACDVPRHDRAAASSRHGPTKISCSAGAVPSLSRWRQPCSRPTVHWPGRRHSRS